MHGFRHAHDLIVTVSSCSSSLHTMMRMYSCSTTIRVMKDRDTRGGPSSTTTKGAEPTVRSVVTRERGQLTFSLDTLSLSRAPFFSALHCLPAFVRGHEATLLSRARGNGDMEILVCNYRRRVQSNQLYQDYSSFGF